jgi:hypothetical protein
MKVLIINFNRLTLPAALADWVAARGCEPIFIDNQSDYAPLLDYYHSCPYLVMHMNRNFGHTVPWLPEAGVLARLGLQNERYIATDSDLDLAGIPDDWLAVLNKGLDLHPQAAKCGFSLRLDDLPQSTEGQFIRQCEASYWTKPLRGGYFDAPTDTTFALYRAGATAYTHSAVRAKPPYTARHIPWYYTDFNLLPADEQHYFRTANGSSTGKKRLFK